MTPILSYRGFHDVPEVVVVTTDDGFLVFDRGPFDEAADEYPSSYTVYGLPWSEAPRLHGTWDRLTAGIKPFGTVAIQDVEFDPTRRAAISSALVASFAERM